MTGSINPYFALLLRAQQARANSLESKLNSLDVILLY